MLAHECISSKNKPICIHSGQPQAEEICDGLLALFVRQAGGASERGCSERRGDLVANVGGSEKLDLALTEPSENKPGLLRVFLAAQVPFRGY